ncbi:hypothetical protein PRIPAC_87378, partial [Pristionchus pacificus]|uniref:Uncharacterized protein n=1 Tax=Pristionchus pacificus TaxID=54126 RepID=A0A2A6B5Q2_PRIPA
MIRCCEDTVRYSAPWKEMKRFLASVKPIFANDNVIMRIDHEVIHEYSEFLKGKNLQYVCVSYPFTENSQ